MFKNPVQHNNIAEVSMTSLDANEALVVYRQDPKTKNVDRYVQFGPTLFMPQATEWYVHVKSSQGSSIFLKICRYMNCVGLICMSIVKCFEYDNLFASSCETLLCITSA